MKAFSIFTAGVVSFATVATAHAQQPVDTAWADAQRQVAHVAELNAAKTARTSAEQQLARAEQELQRALEGAGGAMASLGDNLAVSTSHVGGATRNPVIIRYTELDLKDQANLEEDLAVMGHILDKSIADMGGRRPPRAMGIDVLSFSGSGPLRTLYLEGYGALFLANVGFPLVPPAAKPAEDDKEPSDSAWDEARQELYGGVREPRGQREREPYSQQNVDKLKNSLFAALKNATHLRALKPDEFITLCVFGGSGNGALRHRTQEYRTTTGVGGGRGGLVWSSINNEPQQGTVMTIRVRKADVDAFAKGELTIEAFTQKAKCTAYPGNGLSGGGGGFLRY